MRTSEGEGSKLKGKIFGEVRDGRIREIMFTEHGCNLLLLCISFPLEA